MTISGVPYKNKKHTAYAVANEYLLYQIADAGLLHIYLHGVNKDKSGNKVFFFDRHIEIKEIIDRFLEEGKEKLIS